LAKDLDLLKPLKYVSCLNARDLISMQSAKRLQTKNNFKKRELCYYELLNSLSKAIINLSAKPGQLSVCRANFRIEACGREGTWLL